MGTLFNGRAVLRIFADGGLLELDSKDRASLDFSFSITATRKKEPNQARVQVFGIGDDDRAKISAGYQGLEILVSPNNDDTPVLIFTGVTTYVTRIVAGHLDGLEMWAGEGEREFARVPFRKNYSDGTPVLTIIKDVVDTMELPLDIDPFAFSFTEKTLRSETYDGLCKDVLTELASDYDFTWSIQRGTVEILEKYGKVFSAVTAPLLTLDTGLIEFPTLIEIQEEDDLKKSDSTKKGDETKRIGVRTVSLLIPEIAPGRPILIEDVPTIISLPGVETRSLSDIGVTGLYICDNVIYKGETLRRIYTVEAESRRADGLLI